jgi:D-3-phosphoglycerate dehydrogenase
MDPNPLSSLARDAARRRPLVVVTEHLADEAADWLARHFEVLRCGIHEERFVDAAPEVEALVVRTYTRVDEAILAHLPRLKVVGRAGVGLDNIDLDACRARGVQVVYAPDANTQAVVEYILCLICDVLRPRLFLEEPVDSAEWNLIRQDVVGLWQMNELTLGILGLGRIGKRVAEVARAIGFTVIYHDIEEIPAEKRFGAEPVSAERLFAESDLLTIHIDGRPSNRGFVSRDLIRSMRPDSYLINTSRGFVLDAQALAEWLRENPAAAAMLDVHDPEPFGEDYPLVDVPNAYLAPHLASRTMTAMDNMSWVVKDIAAVLGGRAPRFPAW